MNKNLIAFCGIDGSGKTTQIAILKKSLEENGRTVFIEKQPSLWYRNDERVKKYLAGKVKSQKLLLSELALFSASDKLRQYQEIILPRLQKNEIVLMDRYVYSAYAYFITRGLKFDWLQEINKMLPLPDYTIYLDVPSNIAYKRIKNRNLSERTIEEQDRSKLEEVRNVFLSQPWGKNDKYIVINGNDDKNVVAKMVISNLYTQAK